MAYWTVKNGTGGDDSGGGGVVPDWTNAAESIGGLITASGGSMSNGDVVLLADNHIAGYTGNTTLLFPVSVQVISVSAADNTYSSGAIEQVTNGHFNLDCADRALIVIEGVTLGPVSNTYNCYFYGEGGASWQLRDCTFNMAANGTMFLADEAFVLLEECALGTNTLNATSFFAISGNCRLHVIKNTMCPTDGTANLLGSSVGSQAHTEALFEGCDLSQYSHIYQCNSARSGRALLRKCRLKSGVAAFETSFATAGWLDEVIYEYCDSAALTATPLGLWGYSGYAGTAATDVTVYRQGSDGENSYSYKLTCNANASRLGKLLLPQRLSKWHDASSTKTLTVYLLSDDAGLTDDELGIRVFWNDEAATPYTEGEFLNTWTTYGDGVAADVSGFLKSDSSSWIGGEGKTKYKFVVPGISPKEPGFVVFDVRFGTPSKNLWVCPKVNLA